jgi:hypothetical protein
LGTVTFVDNSNGFPGGWDGIQWADGDYGSEFGPIDITVDAGNGPETWSIYRTDFSGIGTMSWTVNFN